MRDLFLLAVLVAYLVIGIRAPFVLGLGYIWADYFSPQQIGFSFMSNVPVSLILGIATIFRYSITLKKDLPRFVPGIWLLLVLALWITLTTAWSVVPDSAWETWDWAFKTVIFAAFIPFLFRTRVQLESMLLTLALGVGGTLIASAAKTLLGGGRYGAAIGLQGGNSGLAEQSTLSCVAVATIPIFLYLHHSGVIIKNRTFSFLLFYGLVVSAIIASIGTFERTAVVTLGVLGLLLWLNSKRKVLIACVLAAVVVTGGYFVSQSWLARMDTIQNYQGDVSAMTRVAVWEWTWDYAISHPWGGGFDLYQIDQILVPVQDTSQPGAPFKIVPQHGRAFHSTYFEILGEHGFPGLFIFAAIMTAFFASARWVRRNTKAVANLSWAHSLAGAISMSAVTYLAGAAFVGIGFQPFLYDLIAAGVVLNECVRRQVFRPSASAHQLSAVSATAS